MLKTREMVSGCSIRVPRFEIRYPHIQDYSRALSFYFTQFPEFPTEIILLLLF